MKLYFYFLESNGIVMEKCEVIEKPKTYKSVAKFPFRWLYKTVNKSDIDTIESIISCNVVILTQPDKERASKLFMMYLEDERERANREIQNSTENIRNIDIKSEMIERWRNNNE